MKTKLNKLMYISALLTIPCAALATPTVTFEGEVTTQTCGVDINGQTDSVVLLPTVAITDFGASLAAGQTAGLTPFTISLTGCQAPSADTDITTKFLGYNVDSSTGVLGNTYTGSDAASGFGIQLFSEAAGTNAVVLNGVTAVPGLVLKNGETSADYQFSAKYYSLGTTGTAGKITAVAEYTVSYL
ncbi:fimbrial protein [Proteus mirabilis]|uniref:fimbrial protein n=1 Tax=Morganellaceae TaxID=1903414 RepID=UPI001FABCD6F|nr:fimbrial protein [Proteus mirabilis]MCI9740282.1 type 1 fimbrial protein [Proteus mirabilis]MCI9754214.1 type 1 fimbrial protein [Proteus mirabilis]MCI9764891.1 type 1 fimbrial protein [Proteus mirabilis]MCI9783071.1 type 1 fimbrial protein [Proteus mirabilis]MDX4950820.1 fimbrial protein [Proteus mirabilis]